MEIDSLCYVIDRSDTSAFCVKIKNQNLNTIEWQTFYVDTVTDKYLKVFIKTSGSKMTMIYYLFDKKLIRVDKLQYKETEPVNYTCLYFKNQEICYADDQNTDMKNIKGYINKSKEILAYNEFVQVQH